MRMGDLGVSARQAQGQTELHEPASRFDQFSDQGRQHMIKGLAFCRIQQLQGLPPRKKGTGCPKPGSEIKCLLQPLHFHGSGPALQISLF